MSWSVSCIGKPANVVAHLKKYGESLSGMSKEEFDAVLPSITTLVTENFCAINGEDKSPLINFIGSGSGYKADAQTQRACTVKIEPMYATLV